MAPKQGTRTLECAWCSREFRVPPRRGPAPLYCSQACRQGAYRDRHARGGGGRPGRQGGLAELRVVLEAAASRSTWREARAVILGALENRDSE